MKTNFASDRAEGGGKPAIEMGKFNNNVTL